MKSICTLLGCCFSVVLIAQSLTKIKLTTSDFIMNEIVGMSVFGNIGATPGTKVCGINCSNTKSNQNEMMLLPFYNETDIKKGIFIYHKEGNFYINKLIQTGYDEVFFLGTYNNAGSENLMVFGIYSLKLKSIKILKIVSLANDPNFILNPVDVIYSNNTFYILAESLIEYLFNYNKKIILIKFDGTEILWSYIYNSIAPIHSEAPRSMAMDPNGNLCVGGTILRSGDSSPRMMLAQFDLEGNPLQMKSVELKSADLQYNHRYGWIFVKSLGTNIHLFSQSIEGVSEPGSLLVTMFDTDLTLRTWRNYTVPIRVESANIEGGFFLFGGQAPIEFAYEGFSLMKVNSSNAIVEQFRNYKLELKNKSVTTSSFSVYDRATDNIWTMIKPNGTIDNQLILLENSSKLDNRCAEDLTSSVAKDPIELGDLPFASKALQLQLSDIDGNVREIDLSSSELCNLTKSEDLPNDQSNIYPNPMSQGFKIQSTKTFRKIEIINSVGMTIYTNSGVVTSFNFNSTLPFGIYFVKLTFNDGSTGIKKLISN